MHRFLMAAGVVGAAFAMACSSSSSASAPADGGEHSSKDGSGGGSSTGRDAGSGTGSGSGGASTEVAGGVSFFAGGGVSKYLVDGDFLRGSGTLTAKGVVCGAPVDGCKLCGEGDAGISKGTLQIRMLSAGTITTKDGAQALATLNYQNPLDAGGAYLSSPDASLTWAAGDTLTATATGAAFPAFSGSVKAPKDIAGATPTLSLSKAAKGSVSSPFTMSWTPSSDNAQMTLVLGGASGHLTATISCTADESAGKISVDASLLTSLYGSAGGSGTASLSKQMVTNVSVSGVDNLTVMAEAPTVEGQVAFSK